MNLNPNSPLSGKPLSECDNREVDAWIALRSGAGKVEWAFCMSNEREDWYSEKGNVPKYTTDGNAALALMASDVWPNNYSLGKYFDDYAVYNIDRGVYVSMKPTPAEAIARAWIVAYENRKATP